METTRKNKIISLLLIISLVLVFNINIQMRSISCSKLESLANCESSVIEERGEQYRLKCYNIDGSEYSIPCCDFAPGYLNQCKGRKCYD